MFGDSKEEEGDELVESVVAALFSEECDDKDPEQIVSESVDLSKI